MAAVAKPDTLLAWYRKLIANKFDGSKFRKSSGRPRVNVTMEDSGFLIHRKYLLHDHDSKFCSSFRQVIEAGSVKTLALPPRSPNLNALCGTLGKVG